MGEQHTVKDFPPLSANLVPCTPLTADCFTLPPGHASQWVRGCFLQSATSSCSHLTRTVLRVSRPRLWQRCSAARLKRSSSAFSRPCKDFFSDSLEIATLTKKVCFLALNKAQEYLFLLDYFLPKMKQNKHFPLFGAPDVWAVKAVTLLEEPSAGIADCEFQVHQWIGQRCAKIQRLKINIYKSVFSECGEQAMGKVGEMLLWV